MAKKSLKSAATAIIEPVINELGYELVDVEYKNPGGPWKLIVYIYKKDGISFEDCELVSKSLDPLLDANEETAGHYDFLQVSSPGLDREFKYLSDYLRNIDEKIEISLYAPKDGKKKFIGVLKGADQDKIIIEGTNGDLEFNRKEIAKAVLAIEF